MAEAAASEPLGRSRQEAAWVETLRGDCEPEHHWRHRREFLLRNAGGPPAGDSGVLQRLVSLSMVWANHVFLGCRYPLSVMEKVLEMAEGIKVTDAPAHTTRDELVAKVKKRGISSSNEGVEEPCKKRAVDKSRDSKDVGNDAKLTKTEVSKETESMLPKKEEKDAGKDSERSLPSSSSNQEKSTVPGTETETKAANYETTAKHNSAAASASSGTESKMNYHSSMETKHEKKSTLPGVPPAATKSSSQASTPAVAATKSGSQASAPVPAAAKSSSQASALAAAKSSTQASALAAAAPPAAAKSSTQASAPAAAKSSTQASAPAAAKSSTQASAPAAAKSSTQASAPAAAKSSTQASAPAAAPAAAKSSTQASAPAAAPAAAKSSTQASAPAPAAAKSSTQASAPAPAPAAAKSSTQASAPAPAPAAAKSSTQASAPAPAAAKSSTQASAPAPAPAAAKSSTQASAPAPAAAKSSTQASAPAPAPAAAKSSTQASAPAPAAAKSSSQASAPPAAAKSSSQASAAAAVPAAAKSSSQASAPAAAKSSSMASAPAAAAKSSSLASAPPAAAATRSSSLASVLLVASKSSSQATAAPVASKSSSQASENPAKVSWKPLTSEDAKERQPFFNRLYKAVAWKLVAVGGFSPNVNHAELLNSSIQSVKATLDVTFVPLKELADLPQNKSSHENIVCELRCKSVYLGTGCGKSKENAKAIASREALKLFLKKKVIVKICKRKYKGREIEDLVLLDEESKPSNLPPALRNPQEIL
ncbi:CDKN2A-interacting protein isoform X4 [Dermochelys coriacea]|uniref:CDKN2A-interacting protein isoform X4 n=1 Tax=Dermochelys coriacea TaxID=27794 RepID=UPI001CA80F78|nr:CDKN2A-interacting protein isoform X4 [Dermochelys coriacea]